MWLNDTEFHYINYKFILFNQIDRALLGFEPRSSWWEIDGLPLDHHACVFSNQKIFSFFLSFFLPLFLLLFVFVSFFKLFKLYSFFFHFLSQLNNKLLLDDLHKTYTSHISLWIYLQLRIKDENGFSTSQILEKISSFKF